MHHLYTVGIILAMDGQGLRTERKNLGYTQEELARILGVSANTVARWERDEMPFPSYLELALKAIPKNKKT